VPPPQSADFFLARAASLICDPHHSQVIFWDSFTNFSWGCPYATKGADKAAAGGLNEAKTAPNPDAF